MVTTTRTTTTTPIERSRVVEERSTTNSQAGLWITLAVIAFAALGYAFYHYSNPANNPSAMGTSASSSQTAAPVANDSNTNAVTPASPSNGAVMNNDTSTAPNTGLPSNNSTNQPAMNTNGASNSPDTSTNSSSTAQ